MILLGDQPIGGYMATPPGAPPIGHWLSYLGVDDAAATCTKITSLGGKVWKPPMPMGDFGTMAIVTDALGAGLALWQPARAEASPDYTDRPGAWCWNELSSHDPVKAANFYTQLGFSVAKMDMPTGAYHVLSSGGKQRAGIMQTPMDSAPEAWMPYVQVASVDATVAKAQQLGSQIHLPPTDIPGVGRLAIFTDPQGGWLGLLAPARG